MKSIASFKRDVLNIGQLLMWTEHVSVLQNTMVRSVMKCRRALCAFRGAGAQNTPENTYNHLDSIVVTNQLNYFYFT